MKKLFLVLCVLAFATFVQAGNVNTLGLVGSAAPASGMIGNNAVSTGNISTTTTYEDRCLFYTTTTTTAGVVTYAHVETSGMANGTSIFIAMYSSDLSTKLAEGSVAWGGGDGVAHIQLASSFTLVAATAYVLAVGTDTASDYYTVKALAATGIPTYQDSAWVAEIPLPGSITEDVERIANASPRLWFTNTADGG